jgi:hypothetical protein
VQAIPATAPASPFSCEVHVLVFASPLSAMPKISADAAAGIVALTYIGSGALYIVLFGFNLAQYDEFTYAAMTADFARLFVPEPLFYGQDYNFPLEAWLGAPLVAAKLFDALTAVKIAAYALFAAPFMLAGWIAHRRGQSHVAFAIWILPFLSSLFFIVAPMPRGFNQGVAFAALAGILFVSRSEAPLPEKLLYFGCLALAFHINPSSAIVIAPVLALGLTEVLRYPMRVAVVQSSAMWSVFLLVFTALFAWRDAYFRNHANLLLFEAHTSAFSDMIDTSGFFRRLRGYPAYLTGYGIYLAGIVALTLWAAARQRLSIAVCGAAFSVALVLGALNPRVTGEPIIRSLYGQHPVRLFTGIPYVLAVLLVLSAQHRPNDTLAARSMVPKPLGSRHDRTALGGMIFFCAAIMLCVFHIEYFVPQFNAAVPPGGSSGFPLRNTLAWCKKLNEMIHESETILIVDYSPEIAYLCEAISKVHTLHVYERRTYRLREIAGGKFKTLLVRDIPSLCRDNPVRRLPGGSGDDLCFIDVTKVGDLNDWLIAHGVPIREGRKNLLPSPRQ